MPNCSEFYAQRNVRTSDYVQSQQFDTLPVAVAIDSERASMAAGQLALLGLANQLARVHRRISFALPSPSVPLCVRTPFAAETLGQTLLSMVTLIDPCGEYRIGPPDDHTISIGIGETGSDIDFFIGADRAIGRLSTSPVGFSDVAGTLRGAALASCLGAAAVFRKMLGLENVPHAVSTWNYLEEAEASAGPQTLEPLNVGRVLIVGAGAVTASLLYWLLAFGVDGEWTIVDRDVVELHNTNRGMIFTAADAGWPVGSPRRKAELLAAMIPGARSEPEWYHESRLAEEDFDVVLGLANDHDVRHFIASRNNTVTLHATTGANWLSQLHRHITGLDDCIWCRAGEIHIPTFGCSAGSVEVLGGIKTDAALPFLSAASGLMLATALQRLQCGELGNDRCNDWRWDFGSTYRMASSGFRSCREGCSRILPPVIRKRINQRGRWRGLDTQASNSL